MKIEKRADYLPDDKCFKKRSDAPTISAKSSVAFFEVTGDEALKTPEIAVAMTPTRQGIQPIENIPEARITNPIAKKDQVKALATRWLS